MNDGAGNDGTGRRERRKQQTRRALSEAAIALFLERGFDQVSVAEVAEVADVSKATVFNYFPTKEDLVLHRFDDHYEDAAAAVRDRDPGESVVAALRRRFLAGLDQRDVTTGLNDDPQVLAFQRLARSSPSLRLRILEQAAHGVGALTAAVAGHTGTDDADVIARVAASQIRAVETELVVENVRRLLGGESAHDVYPDAVAAALRAFGLLEHGIGDIGV